MDKKELQKLWNCFLIDIDKKEADVAREATQSSRSALNQKIQNASIRLLDFVTILEHYGYTIQIAKKQPESIPTITPATAIATRSEPLEPIRAAGPLMPGPSLVGIMPGAGNMGTAAATRATDPQRREPSPASREPLASKIKNTRQD